MVQCVSKSFSFKANILLIRSSVNRHFHFLAMMNKAAVNIGIQVICFSRGLHFFGVYTE